MAVDKEGYWIPDSECRCPTCGVYPAECKQLSTRLAQLSGASAQLVSNVLGCGGEPTSEEWATIERLAWELLDRLPKRGVRVMDEEAADGS